MYVGRPKPFQANGAMDPLLKARPTVHVLGRGAIGVLLAARLSEAGFRVCFYDQVAEGRLELRVDAFEITTKVTVLGRLSYDRYRPADGSLVVVAHKWPRLITVIPQIVSAWGSNSVYLFPQNGLLDIEHLASANALSAWPVVVWASVERTAPNVIRLSSFTSCEVADQLCAPSHPARIHLSKAGFRFLSPDAFRAAQVGKLLVASTSSLMASLSMSIGAALENESIRDWIGSLVDEGYEVLASRVLCSVSAGERKQLECISQQIRTGRFLVEPALSFAYTSLHHDLARRLGETEARWINGVIVREAAAIGASAPLNKVLLELMEGAARKRLTPSEIAKDGESQRLLSGAFLRTPKCGARCAVDAK